MPTKKVAVKAAKKKEQPVCWPVFLPGALQREAAIRAVNINPVNRPQGVVKPAHLAVLTSKYWGSGGVKLTVSFPFDRTPASVQKRILEHANAWGKFGNVEFTLVTGFDAEVRIARQNDGYWSYVGTDIRSIPRDQPTMNLQGFTDSTPESEYRRVVRHEFGHTLGFPHEHMRQELVSRLDRNKTIAWGRRELGWDQRTVIQQILTPLTQASIMGTPDADQDSIMCYQLPASITKDGQPINGGSDINPFDQGFVAKIYPLTVQPPPPPPDGTGMWHVMADGFDARVRSANRPTVEAV